MKDHTLRFMGKWQSHITAISPTQGETQRDGKAFLWSVCRCWPCMLEMSTIAFPSTCSLYKTPLLLLRVLNCFFILLYIRTLPPCSALRFIWLALQHGISNHESLLSYSGYLPAQIPMILAVLVFICLSVSCVVSWCLRDPLLGQLLNPLFIFSLLPSLESEVQPHSYVFCSVIGWSVFIGKSENKLGAVFAQTWAGRFLD